MRTVLINIIFTFLWFLQTGIGQVVELEKTLQTKVLSFSGTDMYIALGGNQEIAKGDTLYLKSIDHEDVLFVVVQSSSKHALLHPLAELIPLSMGQEVEFGYSKEVKKEQKIEEIKPVEKAQLVSFKKEKAPKKKKIRVSGRVFAGVNALYSSTKWNESQSEYINRFSAEPNSGFSLNVTQLPGNISLKINSRLDYRYSDYRPVSPALQLRMYQFQVEKKLEKVPILIRIGRFYNNNDSYSGFWDGALIELGNYSSGIGIIAGTEPDRSSEGFDLSQPKLSVYSYLSKDWKILRTRTEVSFTHLEPNFGFYHNYLGIRENLRIGKTRLNMSFQMDRKPDSGTWINSYSYANLSQPIGKSLLFTARYSYRQPFRYWSSNPFGIVSHQYGTGLTWNHSAIRIGTNVFMNNMESGFNSKSLNTWLQLNSLTKWNINWNLNNSIWTGNSAFAISASSSWSKQWENLWLNTGYQFNYSNYFDSITQTHGIYTQIQKTFSTLGTLNFRYSLDAGPLLFRSSVFISLWKSF